MTSHNKRKSKIPQKRESSACMSKILNFNLSSNPENATFDKSVTLLAEGNRCLNEKNQHNNQLKCENEKKLNYFVSNLTTKKTNLQIASYPSALILIFNVLPPPSIEISENCSNSKEITSMYEEIRNTCTTIDSLIHDYLKSYTSEMYQSVPNIISENLSSTASNHSAGSSNNSTVPIYNHPSVILKNNNLLSNLTQTNNATRSSYYNCSAVNDNSTKKKTFRGTSDEENKIDNNFQPAMFNDEIILSHTASDIRVPLKVFQMMLLKASNSATRLIRLLMKNFFSQKVLADSSLSGEGYYKQQLNPRIINAIKDFIRNRHPKLKNGSINLCMTDVCVQARRVYKSKISNQKNS